MNSNQPIERRRVRRARLLPALLALWAGWAALVQAQRTATATGTVAGGRVVGILVVDGGAGYSSEPPVALAGVGSGATAQASVSNGMINQIVVLNPGVGYTRPPDVVIGSPDSLTPRLGVRTVTLLTLEGDVGWGAEIQYLDLTGDSGVWLTLTNSVLGSRTREIYDRQAPPGVKRVYRAMSDRVGPTPAGLHNMVWVPPGEFSMGSSPSEWGRWEDEGPQVRVRIAQGFWMSRNETTQREYTLVVGTNPSQFGGDPERPVEQVSWFDATNFCARLTAQESNAGRLPAGYAYRLPTEAEWEYACRAGSTDRFDFGNDHSEGRFGAMEGRGLNLAEHAWFSENSDSVTHAARSKEPSRWGLYDLHGNVAEWCLDWYGAYPGGSITDPRGAVAGSCRVVRGGSWVLAGKNCRAASRARYPPDRRSCTLGFRPVLALRER
jgi:formylglycine-generating enzyme required for sulfatase activity